MKQSWLLLLAMAPIMPVYNPDGSYNFDQWNWQYKHPQIVNPVALANEKEDQMKRYRFLGNVYGEYELYKDLKLKTNFGVDFNSYSRSYYRPSTLPTSLDRVPPSVPEGSKRDKNMLNWVWGKYIVLCENIQTRSSFICCGWLVCSKGVC